MVIKVGMSIKWTDFYGSETIWSFDGFETEKEAYEYAIKSAPRMGWPGNPKWWQWWRANDTKLEPRRS